ncbi:acetolactate synthase [Clostridia bacterium]|nr:acetolactate synthase [Clostridia bacterium]
MSNTLNGAAIVVETLISHGVDKVFGFPGGAVLHLYDQLYLYRDKISHYLFCHEQGAAHAADGFARATGKTGVVIATSGPGATNLVTGIATAYLDSVPLVAITGNVALPLIGKDSFQEVDIAGITMPVTKHNYIVKDINELEDILREAFKIARSGRPGPVLVDIPKDIQAQTCAFRGGVPLELKPAPVPEPVEIRRAAALINAAKRPYIYAGGGVIISGAYEELRELSHRIDSPVGLSMMGLTALRYDSGRNLGMTGMHGAYASSMMNSEADCIIGIGVRFSDRATGDKTKYQENTKIIHIDIDESEINKIISNEVAVIGDIRATLKALLPLLTERERPEWLAKAAEYKKFGKDIQNVPKDMFTPRNIIKTVRKYTTDSTVVATDVGQHQMWTAQHYDFGEPRTLLTSGGLGTMGFGLGAALGASVALGGVRTVLFTGDGSFHMNLQEVATAVMHGLPVVIIIMDNRVLGMVRQWQGLFYENRYSNTTMDRPTDYVKLAEAFGARGFLARSMEELSAALEQTFAPEGANRPTVIDCVIDRDERVLPMIPPGSSVDDIITA